MPTPRCHLLPAVLSLAVAAAAQSEPGFRPARAPEFTRYEIGGGRWGDRWLIEAQAIPGVWLTLDTDGSAATPPSITAYGQGLRAAYGNRDQSVGLLYQGFRDGDDFEAHALSLDVDARMPIDDGTKLFWLKAGGGFGGALLDAAFDPDLAGELTGQLRLGIDFQPTRSLLLNFSLGGIGYAHPGETVAYGAIATLSIGFTF
ncbi:MAG: hypothetical protein ACK5AL_11925 [Planctomycetota bacterium]|jgi:hypothetical protein